MVTISAVAEILNIRLPEFPISSQTTKIGKRGTVVIPAKLRRGYGLEEGSLVNVEAHPEGLLLRPVVTLPVEIYTTEKRAEFILNNALTWSEYRQALAKVRAMGLDPKIIPHERPRKREKRDTDE